MTTAETAWTEAMRYENRHDPYRFFDELRETPWSKWPTSYVTGYRELLTLAHDPHIAPTSVAVPSRRNRRRTLRPTRWNTWRPTAGAQPHRVRPAQARQAAQTGDAALRPATLPGRHPEHGDRYPALCNEMLDGIKAKGENRFDVVDDYAYPIPVAVICKILGVPVKDEPTFHGWIFDFMAGADMGPTPPPKRAGSQLRGQGKYRRAHRAVHGRVDPGFREPRTTCCCPSW